jgi:hypothetical protein
MPDEIAILRATGHEDAAKILEALRAEQTAALPPAAQAAPAAAAAAQAEPPKLTLADIDAMTPKELAKIPMSDIDAALVEGAGS